MKKKNLFEVTCEINSVEINFLVGSDATVNIIDIDTIQKISKVCEISLEINQRLIYTFGSNNLLKLKK